MLGGAYISRSTTPALFEARTLGDEEDEQGEDDDDEAEAERNRNVVFSKDAVPLESRISRIFYLNAYGNEIYPRANPQFTESLSSATTYVPVQFRLASLTSISSDSSTRRAPCIPLSFHVSRCAVSAKPLRRLPPSEPRCSFSTPPSTARLPTTRHWTLSRPFGQHAAHHTVKKDGFA
jgi:hypothetical protein